LIRAKFSELVGLYFCTKFDVDKRLVSISKKSVLVATVLGTFSYLFSIMIMLQKH
jgi:hypothetical protein